MAKINTSDVANNTDLQTAPKISDITSDDSVAATSSSRPMIVSNRPIMRDPMMVQATEPPASIQESDPAGVPPLSSYNGSTGSVLAPPSVTKKKLTPPSEKLTEPRIADVIPNTKIDVVGVVTHDSIPESEKVKQADGSEADENKGLDDPNDVVDTKEADEIAQVAKLVESHTYALPINAVQRRRSQQVAVFGLVLIVLLAFAWLDLASDIGLIKVPYLPVTHFFVSPPAH
jgi:hypothetical protein